MLTYSYETNQKARNATGNKLQATAGFHLLIANQNQDRMSHMYTLRTYDLTSASFNIIEHLSGY